MRRVYHTTFPDLGSELDQAWTEWAMRHGFPDLIDIPAHSEFVCDDQARTITVEHKMHDRLGNPIIICDETCRDIYGDGHHNGPPWHTETIMTEWLTIQLESPALPFPPGGDQNDR